METKVLKRLADDLKPVTQIARMLRDESMTDAEREQTTKTLCDTLSRVTGNLDNYLEVIAELKISRTVESLMKGIKE